MRKPWLWWLVGVGLVMNLILVGTPYGLGYGLKRYLLDQGLEQVDLGDVDFNPFTGRLTVDALEASAGGRVVFGVPEGTLDLGWLPLLRKRVYIEQVTLKGAEIVLSEQEDGSWRYGGLEPPWEEEIAPVEDAATLWEVGARELHLIDVHYRVEGRQLRAEIAVDEARLERAAAWEPDQAGALSIRGRVNGAELALTAEAWPFARIPRITGKVKLTGFPLAPMAPFGQPALETLQGHLDLDVNLEGQYTPEAGFTLAQKGVVALNGLQARSKALALTDDSLRWEGRVKVSVPSSGLSSLTAEGALTQGETAVSMPAEKFSVGHRGLSWQGTIDYAPAEAYDKVAADGQLEFQGLHVVADRRTATHERLTWQGKVQLSLPHQDAGPEVTAEGKLDGGDLTVNLPDGTTFAQTELKWQGKLHQSGQDGTTAWRSKGKLETRGLRLERPHVQVQEDQLSWAGSLSLTVPGSGDPIFSVDGKLAGGEFQAAFPGQRLETRHQALSWAGRFDRGGGGGTGASESDFSVRGLEVSAPDRALMLLSLEDVQLEGIRVDGAGTGRVARTRLGKITMLAPTVLSKPAAPSKEPAQPAALFRASEAVVEGLELKPPLQLGMGVLQVDGAAVLLRRDEQGRWHVLDRLRAMADKPEVSAAGGESAASATGTDGGITVRIDLVRLKDGQVRFEDEAVSPPFRTTLRIPETHVTDLNSGNPEQRSELSFKGQLGRYAGVKLRTQFQPFRERLSLNGTAEVDNLEMPPLAPYTIQQVGYTFTSGELDAEVDLAIDQGDIDGEARLVFTQLEVAADPSQQTPKPPKPAADRQETEMEKGPQGSLKMPIKTALSLLRDKDNSIRLRIPIRGDVDDPQFSVQDAINKALAKASRETALASVKFAIQPYGAILTAVEIAGKAVTVVRLDPVTFNAGQSQLTEAGTGYLDKVSKVLKDRPQVTIKLCAKATEGDRQALQAEALATIMVAAQGDQREEGVQGGAGAASTPSPPDIPDAKLKALAETRAVGVEDHLVQTHGVDAGRLVICRPKIDSREDAQPRVDLEI